MRLINIVFLAILFSIAKNFAQVFEIDYYSGPNYEFAKFRVWIPKTGDGIRAMLVIMPGFNIDGRNEINDRAWREFAIKNNFGIVATYFKDYEGYVSFYRDAKSGSGEALINAISEVSLKSGLSKIKNVPLVMWGISAGGQFNYEFACWKPEKVLTFVVNKGGYYNTCIAPDSARKIPAIFYIGESDEYYRKDIIKGIFSLNRKVGSNWTLVSEKNTNHEVGISKTLSLEFFKDVIPLRLSPDNKLIDISENEYYLGNWETKKIRPCKGMVYCDTLTVWLPNHEFASTWEKLYE